MPIHSPHACSPLWTPDLQLFKGVAFDSLRYANTRIYFLKHTCRDTEDISFQRVSSFRCLIVMLHWHSRFHLNILQRPTLETL